MNKRRLEAVMKLNGDTGNTLASYLGIARATFSMKINETKGSEFTQGEILAIKQRYDLTPEEINNIFFEKVVS